MWLLADLFHDLPEEGDLDKPKLVFFFDEAHLLFDDACDAFLDQIAQTVRLIRSKGVGRLLRDPVARPTCPTTCSPSSARASSTSCARTPPTTPRRSSRPSTPTPTVGLRRPRRGHHLARHRRGGRHGDERARRPHPGRVDPAAGPGVADGHGRRRRHAGRGRGLAALGEVRRGRRPRVRPRDARRPARGGRPQGRARTPASRSMAREQKAERVSRRSPPTAPPRTTTAW